MPNIPEEQEPPSTTNSLGLDESFFKTPFQRAILARMKQADLAAAAKSMRDAEHAMYAFGTVAPIEREPRPSLEADRPTRTGR